MKQIIYKILYHVKRKPEQFAVYRSHKSVEVERKSHILKKKGEECVEDRRG